MRRKNSILTRFSTTAQKVVQISREKRRKEKGRNNVKQVPIEEEVSNDMDFPPPKIFTEYFHNEQPFRLDFTSSADCKRANSCMTCKVAFPKLNPAPINAILIIHKERYERPVKDEKGKFLRMTVSNQLGKKFYCVKKICLRSRHPYFWKGMLEVTEEVKVKLTIEQKELILNELNLKL